MSGKHDVGLVAVNHYDGFNAIWGLTHTEAVMIKCPERSAPRQDGWSRHVVQCTKPRNVSESLPVVHAPQWPAKRKRSQPMPRRVVLNYGTASPTPWPHVLLDCSATGNSRA